MDDSLGNIAAAAAEFGLSASCFQVRELVIWRPGSDLGLQVRRTPLGLRYVIFENFCGARFPWHWSDAPCCTLPRRMQGAYIWAYRNLWGWLAQPRWRGLELALAELDAVSLRWEAELEAG